MVINVITVIKFIEVFKNYKHYMKEISNKQISKIIEEIGEMLEIIGTEKDQFRIIAYQNAARKIEMMSREIGDIYNEEGFKGLLKIKGIGESIAEKIEEIIKTGKCRYHDELAKKVPSPIITFLKIPGVGPHLADKLYNCYLPRRQAGKNYKLYNIHNLKKALEKDKSVKFFKEKTKQNILEGIELLSKQTGRMLLSFAEPIAEEIVNALKGMSGIKQAHPVGSLRRMKDTIGDIDIIAAVNSKSQKPKANSQNVIGKYIKMPFVEKIVESGETKATIIHKKGPNVDLEILPDEEYGSLLQHFTGSKEHNIALRTWAEKNGFSLSEHGIKITKNLKLKTQNQNLKLKTIKCDTEEKFYKTLGMDWIPPEIRENKGEIEASLNHQLPKLIKLNDIKGDLHLHSTWSEGEMEIKEIAEYAQKLGYEYIAITDHTAGLGITHGLKEKEIEKYINEINKINSKLKAQNSKLTILTGAEVNILANGNLDISDRELSKLDIIIASIHSGFRQKEEQVTSRLLKAIQNPNVDIIGHPSGRLIPSRQPLNIDWKKVFRAAKDNNVAMEINSHPQRLDLTDDLCLMAKDMGVKMVINTDMHHAEHFKNMRYGVAVARRGWLEKKDVINTGSLSELKAWKKSREKYG